MPDEISTALKIILELMSIIKPSDLQKIKNQINKLEKENDEKKEKLTRAIRDNNIDDINAILFGD
jgi:formate dehydrogenase maturation protein FdhE